VYTAVIIIISSFY